jgi:hypothetical protein
MIKKNLKYDQRSNVYSCVEIRMYIMSKNSTLPICTKFDFCNEVYRYFVVNLWQPSPQSAVGKATDQIPSAHDFLNFFLYIQMFCYTIIKPFIT